MGSSRKVAVIAVHGVGVHAAGQTQNDMADLLLSLPAREYSAERDYGPFRSVSIQIPLSPLKARPFDPPSSPDAAEPVRPPTFRARIRRFIQRAERRLRLGHPHPDEPSAGKGIAPGHVSVAATGEADLRYTQMLLEDYQGGSEVAGNKFCTDRLEGNCLADENQVHIYEVLSG